MFSSSPPPQWKSELHWPCSKKSSPERKKFPENFLSTSLVRQAAIVHIGVSHKSVHRNSINSANIKGLRATPLAIILRSLWRPLSSDYKLTYTPATNAITASISKNNQFVFTVIRVTRQHPPTIINAIIIAAINFIRSITLCRL